MPLDTAVVGAGTVSDTHMQALTENPRTRLVGVCDVDEDRARSAATDHDTRAFVDLETMIDSVDPGWLHLCTPVQTHLELAKVAIEAGIPVLIEKPITTDLEELRELESIAERHGVPVSEVHQHAFDPAMRRLRRRIDSGEVGAVRGVNVVFTGLTPPDEPNRGAWTFELSGGEFEEGLPHPLYLALAAGEYPDGEESIQATTTLVGDYDREFQYDNAQVQFTSPSGALCSVTMTAGGIPQRTVQVNGEHCTLVADLLSQTVVAVDRDYSGSSIDKVLYNLRHASDRIGGIVANARAVARDQFDDDWESTRDVKSHFYQIDLEARALQSGGEMPVSTADVRWTMALLSAIREAPAERAVEAVSD